MRSFKSVLLLNRFVSSPLCVCSRLFIPNLQRLFSQMSGNSSSVVMLMNRLNDAERNIRLLSVEVKKIRMELNRLSSNSGNDTVDKKGDSLSSPIYLKKRAYSDNMEGTSSGDKKCKMDFTYEGDFVVVYTDGACPSNGKRGAKGGLGVWWGDNHPLNVSKPTRNRNTNNTGEIQACTEACKVAADNGIKKLLIKTDSKFTIQCMTQWIKKWKKNNWRKADGKEVINKDDLIDLERESERLVVKYEHVSGHSGIRGNEEADKLAVQGANMN